MASATTKAPWGAANVRNGGGLSKLGPQPRQDDRLLFAMYDSERASRKMVDVNDQLSEDVQKLSEAVWELEPEVKELRESLSKLGALVERLTEVVGDLVARKGGSQ